MLENGGCIGMELRKTAPGAVEVRLSGAELKSLGLSPRERGCWKELAALAQAACAAVGLRLCRPCAQVCPDGAGGCSILLQTQPPPPAVSLCQEGTLPVIYAFEDAHALLQGARQLFSSCAYRVRKSALYRVPHGWRLLLWPLDLGEGTSLKVMDAYAPRCGQGPLAAAWLAEHSRLLLDRDAVGALSTRFC